MPPELRKLFADIGQALNSMTDPNDPNYLGEPWRSQLLEVKGQINASLANLPETDKVPAAQEASWGLNALKNSLMCVQSIISNLSATTKRYAEQTATAKAGITEEVNNGVKAKLESGEYLTKQAATDLAAQSRKDGEAAGFSKGKLLADRRGALALAGLPAEVSTSAPDEILLAEEPAFNAARDAAKERVDKLKGIGLTVASAHMRSLPWATKDIFEAQHTSFSEIHTAAKSAGKGQSNNAGENNTAKASGLIGGTAPGAKEAPLTATSIMC